MRNIERPVRLTPEEQAMREKLIRISKGAENKLKKTIGYQELCSLCGLTSENAIDELSYMLCKISTYEHEHDRPLLSAVVVHVDTLMQGNGFFELAKYLELKEYRADPEMFGVKEIMKCHEFWPDEKNRIHEKYQEVELKSDK